MNITRPSLIINEQICKDNIRRISEKAVNNQLQFRPHFKTHQSTEIGEWFREAGVSKITVSSVSMAEYFADNGWNDILIAFPVNILEIAEMNKLAHKTTLHLTVESVEAVLFLKENITSAVGIYIKIDTGYHRTGLLPKYIKQIDEILTIISISKNLNFTGFLTHSGDTYNAISKQEIIEIHVDSLRQLNALKIRYVNDFPEMIISIGDTPSCSISDDFDLADEIRPGNFVFYDVMQLKLGSCNVNDIAVALACPVVAKHAERMELVIYGGSIHLSSESLNIGEGKKHYGLPVRIKQNGWIEPLVDCFVSRLSQEHGILKLSPEVFDTIQIGDIIGVLPVHSCLTANLAKHYINLNGKKISKIS